MKCGYCNRTFSDWQVSPHGRYYCPECGAIRSEDHNKFKVGSGRISKGN